jgi:hypothetical protein
MTIAPPGTALHYRRRIGKGQLNLAGFQATSSNRYKQTLIRRILLWRLLFACWSYRILARCFRYFIGVAEQAEQKVNITQEPLLFF